MSKKVAVIMGSDSDFPTVSAAVKKLKSFGVPVEVHVMSAHRTPHDAAEFSAILAVQMLAIGDEELAKKLDAMKTEMVEGVKKKDAALQAEVDAL